MYNQRNMDMLQEKIKAGQYDYLKPILKRFKKAEDAKTRRALNSIEIELNDAFDKLEKETVDDKNWIIELLGSYFLNLELMLGKKEKSSNTRWSLFIDSLEKRGHTIVLNYVEEINKYMETGSDNTNRITKEVLDKIRKMYVEEVEPYIEEKMDPVERYRAIIRLKQRFNLLEKKVTSSNNISFGEWVNIKRTAKGWSLYELASKTGYSAAYMYRIESGSRKNPSAQVISKIVTALGYKPDDYLNLVMSDQENEENLKSIDLTDLILLSEYTLNGEEISPEKRRVLAEIIQLIGQKDVLQIPKINTLQEEIKKFQDME